MLFALDVRVGSKIRLIRIVIRVNLVQMKGLSDVLRYFLSLAFDRHLSVDFDEP